MNGIRELNGKVAIVTGAGQRGNIGSATARLLAERRARVILVDLASSELNQTVATLKAEKLDIDSFVADLQNEADIKAVIEYTRDTFGRLDIVDNNAGGTSNPIVDKDVVSMSTEVWDNAMTVNARGTMLVCKHSIPVMIAGGGGSIINISSGTAVAGSLFSTAYACSEGAINTLTKYIATQYGAQQIRCNALVLGLIATSAVDRAMTSAMQDMFRSHHLVGRLGTPNDVAEMVAFLASDRSTFITGQLLPVDGGFFAHVPTIVEMKAM